MTEREIFLAAIGKTEAERSVFLESACSGDAEVRRRLDALLAAHGEAQQFLEAPPSGLAQTLDRTVGEQVGAQIGPYKLLQKLGEGGFGVVYMAEQEKPVRRMVALKIIKPGMDTREVIARFESERQALAIMDHANIARVFDAGATATGRPFFVMELVKGVPITEFCDRNHMPAEQRLALFITACQAIQHAHHKGVIHRDVKPSNVMVTLHDGVPVVKVIDFGVAKATSQKLTEKTLFTAYGQMIGTPAYMSPEQAEMSGLDIDTRSDIYSLGVLLYELLTGTTPLDLKRLRTAGYGEMQRLIREEEAPRPSTRMSSLGGEATLLASNRGTDPRRLAQLLAGDLDWIVMKALDKDRDRRYPTPGSFAEDIERYLRRDAIAARPPSTVYKLKKFAQRNRIAVFLTLFVAATVLSVLINHIVGLHRTRTQRDRAIAAERLASDRLAQVEKANRETNQALGQSETARQQAEALGKFLVQGIRDIDRERGPGPELLDKAAATLGDNFAGSPQHKGELLDAFGVAYLGMDQPTKAIDVLESARAVRTKVLGPDHPDTLETMSNLAEAYRAARRLEEAIALHDQTLRQRQARLGADHEQTLTSMTRLADAYGAAGQAAKAIALHEEALKLGQTKLGEGQPDTHRNVLKVAVAQWLGGERAAAVALLEKTLKEQRDKLGPEHLDTLESMHALTYWYTALGRTDEAVRMGEETARLRKAKLGPLHPQTLYSMDNLAAAYRAAGRLTDAINLHEQRLSLTQSRFGMDHEQTLGVMTGLASMYRDAKRFSDSITLLEEALRLRKSKVGADHGDTLDTMSRLAWAYRDAGRLNDAIPVFEETLRLTKAKLGAEHPDTVEAMRPLGMAYQDAGRLDDSIAHREALLPLMKSKYGVDHQETLVSMNNLAEACRISGRLTDAIALGAELLQLTIAKHGPDDPATARVRMHLAWAYRDAKRFGEAIPHWEEILRVRREQLGEADINTINVMRNLGAAYKQVGRMADSIAIREQTLPLLKAKLGPENSETLTFMSNLGSDYSQRGEHAKAEPLLLAAYQGMKQPANVSSQTETARAEIVQRLVQLYDAWGKPVDAAKWRSELDARGKAAAK